MVQLLCRETDIFYLVALPPPKHCSTWFKMNAPVLPSHFHPSSFWVNTWSRYCTCDFCAYLIGQNLIMWPLLASRESGKCRIYQLGKQFYMSVTLVLRVGLKSGDRSIDRRDLLLRLVKGCYRKTEGQCETQWHYQCHHSDKRNSDHCFGHWNITILWLTN